MTIFIITLEERPSPDYVARGRTHPTLQSARAASQYDGQRNTLTATAWSEKSREPKAGGIFNTAAQQQEIPAWIVELSQ